MVVLIVVSVVVVVVVVVVAVDVAVCTLWRCGDTPALPGAISQGVAGSQGPGVANLNTEMLEQGSQVKFDIFYLLQSFLCWQLRPIFLYKNIIFKWQQWMELNWPGASLPPTRLICQPYNLSLHNSTNSTTT